MNPTTDMRKAEIRWTAAEVYSIHAAGLRELAAASAAALEAER